MHDPTRIPSIVRALERTWEGQPDLSLAQLMGVLQNRGLGWGTTDDEAVALLAAVEREHPSLIDATSPSPAATPREILPTRFILGRTVAAPRRDA